MPPSYSERIGTRLRVWWNRPPPPGQSTIGRSSAHAWYEAYRLRHRDDPDASWRCCAFWPRSLINKWNGREFARKHGAPVPALYWRAYVPSEARLRTLPSHFVLKPVWGAGKVGVYVVANGRDVVHDQPVSPSILRRGVLKVSRYAWTRAVLAEEFVRSTDPRYPVPVEYKCHTFGDTVGAVENIVRPPSARAQTRFYTADWEPIADRMNTYLDPGEVSPRPPFLTEMVELARRLGTVLGTYMRIDFFGGPGGFVFNEFSSTPANGGGCTPHCDRLFGDLWAEKFPSAV
jgi:hypothetical protein